MASNPIDDIRIWAHATARTQPYRPDRIGGTPAAIAALAALAALKRDHAAAARPVRRIPRPDMPVAVSRSRTVTTADLGHDRLAADFELLQRGTWSPTDQAPPPPTSQPREYTVIDETHVWYDDAPPWLSVDDVIDKIRTAALDQEHSTTRRYCLNRWSAEGAERPTGHRLTCSPRMNPGDS